MEIKFTAPDYTSEDNFIQSEYVYRGSKEEGWSIYRNGNLYLKLDKGYIPLKTELCGICSTDISRRFLPFPLPQIIGHELIASSLDTKQLYAVEINDTFIARGIENPTDFFIKEGIPTHSPDRMVLGIDRLPGGFGPYILAPQNSLVPINSLEPYTAVLLEPFAAAIQAIHFSQIPHRAKVAVLGPRRLGSLIIAGLNAYRNSNRQNFEITAIARHSHILDLCKQLGADHTIHLKENELSKFKQYFDLVFDTTGSPEGLELAIYFSKKEVHLKSTNGLKMLGINKLTEFVVDELSLLPYSDKNTKFVWKNEQRTNQIFYVSDKLSSFTISDPVISVQTSISDAFNKINSSIFTNRLPRYDIAIIQSESELEKVIRPSDQSEESLIRPRGAILLKDYSGENKLLKFISGGGSLRSSRCGDFHYAIQILKENPEIANTIRKSMITSEYPSSQISEAFLKAKDPNSIKVVLKHG